MELQELAEGCIAKILSLTSPVDACRLSLVSKPFCSASLSDDVWNHFLPSDLPSIISRSSLSPSSLPSSKKDLYLALSDHHILLDHGTKSFQLDKRSGNKCYMLSARDLSIIWGDNPQYWRWTSLPQSRFQQVAKLRAVCWFEIRGKINTLELSPDTRYSAFLVFKMMDAQGFDYDPAMLSVGISRSNSSSKIVCLDPDLEESELSPRFHGLERPTQRNDGFLEIEMGEFYNSGQDSDSVVHMSVTETKSNWWKHGFVLQGIDLRPKVCD